MGQLAFGVVGAVIGTVIAPGVGTSIGWALGSAVGGIVFAPDGPQTMGPRLIRLAIESQYLRATDSARIRNGRLYGFANLDGRR